MQHQNSRFLGRRALMHTALVGGGSILLPRWLTACTEAGSLANPQPTEADKGDASQVGDGGSTTDASPLTDGSLTESGVWARGGTASMVQPDAYPNPFGPVVGACAAFSTMTAGPCTEAADRGRRDISEGAAGLPLRLGLRFVDSQCNLLANAKVKVWHTNVRGSYSGDTPNNAFCINDNDARTKHYFRGVQTTTEDGIVYFDTCFPGWYPGRAIHIHFTVSVGASSVTSQVFFDQDLIDGIFRDHPDYAPFGAPDTPNASDGVSGSALASLILKSARMSDGAMLAWRDLVIAT